MDFIKLNINSTKPFFTDKLGNIYNCQYKKLSCSKIGESHFLAFVLNDKNKTLRKESIARLIYQTYFPDEDISDCNIFKKYFTIENPYQIDNLKKVYKKDMPVENKLPIMHVDELNPIKRKFYEKLGKGQLNILIGLASSKKIKNSFLAQAYSVSRNTIVKHRKSIATMNIKD